MREMKASEFKAKCLKLMDEVQRYQHRVVITKKGKPVAELVPHRGRRRKSPFGLHKGKIKITGDIISPIDVDWDALK